MKFFLKIILLSALFLISLKASGFPANYYKMPLIEKKKYFFEYFIGKIELENIKILHDRNFIKFLSKTGNLDKKSLEYKRLKQLKIKYKVDNIYDFKEFLEKINIIPPSLALAQAAVESGWGTSRFFKEANNIFGQWTYNPKIGIKPLDRQKDKKHFIRLFETLQESIAAYMLNLNRNTAYKKFRTKRKEIYLKKEPPNGTKLAKTMTNYSGIGHNYVKILESIINKNGLAHYDEEFYALIKNKEMLNLY